VPLGPGVDAGTHPLPDLVRVGVQARQCVDGGGVAVEAESGLLIDQPVQVIGPSRVDGRLQSRLGIAPGVVGCSHPHRHHPDQAGLSFTDLLRQAKGGGLSPPLEPQRPTAQTKTVPEPTKSCPVVFEAPCGRTAELQRPRASTGVAASSSRSPLPVRCTVLPRCSVLFVPPQPTTVLRVPLRGAGHARDLPTPAWISRGQAHNAGGDRGVHIGCPSLDKRSPCDLDSSSAVSVCDQRFVGGKGSLQTAAQTAGARK
jgi:hypothetical protein